MARYSKETTINAPAEKVFNYVSDFPRHSEWAQNNLEVTASSPGPTAAGSTFNTVGHALGAQRESQTVTEYEPGKRFTFESKGALGITRNSFDLAPAGTGTRVTKSLEFVKPSFLARVVSLKVGHDAPKALEEDLRRIKQKLEAS
jgi:uncharacterized membrane protein